MSAHTASSVSSPEPAGGAAVVCESTIFLKILVVVKTMG